MLSFSVKLSEQAKDFPVPEPLYKRGQYALTGGFMNELPEISTVKDKIYTIRGVQVMLDSDLAAIYGYETKNFNRQVKNNYEKFKDEDFMFQLTKDETEILSRCRNFTLNIRQQEGATLNTGLTLSQNKGFTC